MNILIHSDESDNEIHQIDNCDIATSSSTKISSNIEKVKLCNCNNLNNCYCRRKLKINVLTKQEDIIIDFVRTRFLTNRSSAGFACKKAPTISFVERGFERLGLGHQAVGFSWCSYMVKWSSPLESFSWRWTGRLWFFAIFSQPLLQITYFSLYTSLRSLSFVHVQGQSFQD